MNKLINLFLLFFCFIPFFLSATHIKGGFISIEEVNGNTVTFLFTGYRDNGSPIEFGAGTFDFGDGNSYDINFEITKTYLNEELEIIQFRLDHTYQTSGKYRVSYTEEFRNDLILNLGNSINQAFSTYYEFVLDPSITNAYPKLDITHLISQVFDRRTTPYEQSIMVSESDGDLLFFALVEPMQGRNSPVTPYTYPPVQIDEFTGNLVLSLNEDISSQLNHHGYEEYLVAVEVGEYRLINNELTFLGKQVIDFNLTYLPELVESNCQVDLKFTTTESAECLLIENEPMVSIANDNCDTFEYEEFNSDLRIALPDKDTTFILDQSLYPNDVNYVSSLLRSEQYTASSNALILKDCVSKEVLENLVTEVSMQEDLVLYPNPSTGIFNIQSPNEGRVSIFSLDGKEILNQWVPNHVLSLNLDQHEPGVYVLRFSDKNDRLVRTEKIVIVK